MRIFFCKHTIVVVFAIILTLAMSISPALAESASQEPIKVKVLVLPFLSSAPLFIAAEEGFFTEQGLEIEFVKMDETTQGIPALLTGELDVIASDIGINALNSILRGGMLRIVADKGYVDPGGCAYSGLVIRKADHFETPDQIRGLRIATTPTNMHGFFVDRVLATFGLTRDDVTYTEIPFPARPQALESGAVDAINLGEPWITRMLQTGKFTVWKSGSEVVPNFQLAVVIYGATLLETHPEVGQRFMVAFLKAVRQYNQGKTDRNLDILSKYTQLERSLVQATCWPDIRNDGQINPASVLEFQQWAVEHGLLDMIVPADQFWDGRFVKHAQEVLGHATP